MNSRTIIPLIIAAPVILQCCASKKDISVHHSSDSVATSLHERISYAEMLRIDTVWMYRDLAVDSLRVVTDYDSAGAPKRRVVSLRGVCVGSGAGAGSRSTTALRESVAEFADESVARRSDAREAKRSEPAPACGFWSVLAMIGLAGVAVVLFRRKSGL